jgi:hypothetical protein
MVQPTYALGNPGKPSPEPTLLIADFDNSGSMLGPAGSDPLSNRFAEVAHAYRLVARKGSHCELGAVLHFDTPSSSEVAPVPLTRSGFATLQAGLRIPADGAGSSRLAPSLARASDLAAAHPDHQTTLIVLSDFLLLDNDPGAVLARLERFPGTVHAVVLGRRRDALVPLDVASVTHVGSSDPPGAVAKAVFASLTRTRPGSRAFKAAEASKAQTTSPISQHPRPRHLGRATARDDGGSAP